MGKKMLVEDMQVVHATALVSITTPEQNRFHPAFAADTTTAIAPRLVRERSTIDFTLFCKRSLLGKLTVSFLPVQSLPVGQHVI